LLREEMNQLRAEMRAGFEDIKRTLKLILNIVQTYDVERKEIKSTLWEFDRRIRKLEGKPA
jgi:uncharacterized coiled-coil DUF342 family protein